MSPTKPRPGEHRATELRELLVATLAAVNVDGGKSDGEILTEIADALLAGPLADVVREAIESEKRLDALIAARAKRDALLTKLEAVEALAEEWEKARDHHEAPIVEAARELRRALDA